MIIKTFGQETSERTLRTSKLELRELSMIPLDVFPQAAYIAKVFATVRTLVGDVQVLSADVLLYAAYGCEHTQTFDALEPFLVYWK